MIQIKSPCDASWQEMTPAESGKFCGACEKVVVDFSKMNDAEIKNYFVRYKEQKTCGRFLDSQLDRPLVVPSVKPFNEFLTRLYHIPVTRTVLLFLTSTSMWISSCVKNNDAMTTGEPAETTERLVDTTEHVVGFIAPVVKQHDSLLIKQDPDGIKMGEIAPRQTVKVLPPDVIMGEVAAPADFFMSDVDSDTVAVTIPATSVDTSDATIHLIKGKVMMTDTITQKIKRKKK